MGLIFKLNQPLLYDAVDFDGNLNRTGVDFIGFVQIRQQAPLFQYAHTHRCHIHQCDRFIFFAINFFAGGIVFVQRHFDRRVQFCVGDLNVFQNGGERGVPAVVRPIGVDDFQFGDKWITTAFFKIIPAETQIFCGHCKTHAFMQVINLHIVHFDKVFNLFDIGRRFGVEIQTGGFCIRSDTGFHRVDHISPHLHQIAGGNFTPQGDDLCRGDFWAFAPGLQLDTLGGGISALIILPRKIFGSEILPVASQRQIFRKQVVDVRL